MTTLAGVFVIVSVLSVLTLSSMHEAKDYGWRAVLVHFGIYAWFASFLAAIVYLFSRSGGGWGG